MESFFRYIGYLGLWEGNQQLYTVGYIRWRYQQGIHHVEIQVKDTAIGTGQLEIVEEYSKEILGVLSCTEGDGEYKKEFFVDNEGGFLTIGGKKLHPSEIQGIIINLGKERRLQAKLELPVKKRKSEEKSVWKEIWYKKEEKEKNLILEEGNGLEDRREKEPFQENIPEIKMIDIGIKEEKGEDRKEKEEVRQTENRKAEIHVEEAQKDQSAKEQYPKIIEPMKEDKWEQLCKKYEVVYPFGSEQPFITIHLKDFIILQEGYQKLVHNSFLLHGYYNYGHLILGRLEEWEESPYYVGVPGVYYENEKKAARMFGFAGFEGASKTIENGSYGYYMIEVKI